MGAVGQTRAGDSSLLLVREEPDKQGQMRRFSYKIFTEPKPRFLNCDIMPYLVRTVSSRFQPIQHCRIKFMFILPTSPSTVLCSYTDIWERLSSPLDTLISRQQSLIFSFLKIILGFVLYRKYLPGEFYAIYILNSNATVFSSLFSVLQRFSCKYNLTIDIIFFLSYFSHPWIAVSCFRHCAVKFQSGWCWAPLGLFQPLGCNADRCLRKMIYCNLQAFVITFIETMNLSKAFIDL